MPTTVNVATCLGLPTSGKKVKPAGYTGIWAVGNGTLWTVQYTSPGGHIDELSFTGCLPSSPQAGVTYRLYYGAAALLDTTGVYVDIYWDSSTSKFKCGTPP